MMKETTSFLFLAAAVGFLATCVVNILSGFFTTAVVYLALAVLAVFMWRAWRPGSIQDRTEWVTDEEADKLPWRDNGHDA